MWKTLTEGHIKNFSL